MFRTLVSLAILLAFSAEAAGQGISFRNAIRDGIKLGVDSSIAASAAPGIGTGTIDLENSRFFRELDSSQFKLRIYLGSWIQLTDPATVDEVIEDPNPFSPRIRSFLLISQSSNEARGDVPRGLPVLGNPAEGSFSPQAEVVVETTSYRAGGGIRIDVLPWLSFLPTYTLAYNYVRGEADGAPLDKALLNRDYRKALVDWRSESLTHIPELELRLQRTFGDFELRATFYLSYLVTSVFSSTNELRDFSSETSLGVLLTEFDWNTHWAPIMEMDLHAVPALRYAHIEGDAVAGLGTKDIMSVELGLVFDTTDKIPFSGRLGVLARYIFGVNLRGWSVGVFHDF